MLFIAVICVWMASCKLLLYPLLQTWNPHTVLFRNGGACNSHITGPFNIQEGLSVFICVLNAGMHFPNVGELFRMLESCFRMSKSFFRMQKGLISNISGPKLNAQKKSLWPVRYDSNYHLSE